MTYSTAEARVECDGQTTVVVTVHADQGATWGATGEGLGAWSDGGALKATAGTDRTTTYRGKLSPGDHVVGVNVVINGQRHDADQVTVHVPDGCVSTTSTSTSMAPTTSSSPSTSTPRASTTTEQTAPHENVTTSTTVVLDTAITAPTTSTSVDPCKTNVFCPKVDIGTPKVITTSTSVAVAELPHTGAMSSDSMAIICGGATGLLVLGVLFARVGKFRAPKRVTK